MIILSGLFAARWRLSAGAGGWKVERPGEKRMQKESGGRVKVRTPQEKNGPPLQNQNRKGRPPEPSWRLEVVPLAVPSTKGLPPTNTGSSFTFATKVKANDSAEDCQQRAMQLVEAIHVFCAVDKDERHNCKQGRKPEREATFKFGAKALNTSDPGTDRARDAPALAGYKLGTAEGIPWRRAGYADTASHAVITVRALSCLGAVLTREAPARHLSGLSRDRI